MAVFDNLNGTYSAGVSPEVQEYFDRSLIRDVEANLVYQRDMKKVTLPKGNGRTVQFRKFLPYDPITEPLKEGVTPAGQTIRVVEQFATIKPYGRHVEITDELDGITIDNVTRETSMLLNRQARESIDAVCGDTMNGGMNVIYADANGGVNTSRSAIVAGTDVLAAAHIKRAVRALEKAKAPRFPDGYYHAVIDPETKYDLTADPMWVDIAKYQNSEKYDKYELGKMLGVKFYETTQTKVFHADEPLYTDNGVAVTNLALNGGAWDVTKNVGYVTIAKTTLYNPGTDADYAYAMRRLVGRLLAIYDASETKYINCLVDKVTEDGANIKLRLRYLDTAANYTYASGDKLYGTDGGASDADVHSTIIYGQDFAGTVELGGNGKNIHTIIKPCGSAGAADPLNQRGSLAWKVEGFCSTILQDAFGVRIEHSVSA